MTIRPKTKRRLLILLTGVVLFSVSAAWLYSYRIAIAERRLVADEQVGLAAYRNGDYQTAIEKLTEYLNHEQKRPASEMDPQALLAYANARAKVPTKDEDYIVAAVNNLRRYCVLVPNDTQAREQLLEMEAPYSTYTPDAIGRANDILKNDPNNLVALKALGEINFRQQKYSDAQPAVQRYIALAPTDLELQRINFQIMAALSQPPADMQKHADQLLAQYPADPRFKIVKAWAYLYGRTNLDTPERGREEFREYRQNILEAAKADPPSVQFAKTTIGLLDGLAEFGASLDLLNRSSAKFNDPLLTQQTIVRLWQSRKFSDVISRLKDLDGANPTTNANMIALKALSEYQIGQTKAADALVAQLDSRGSDDRVAYAWATTLKAQYANPPEDLKTRAAHYDDARVAAPDNGYVEFLLGDAYAQMGETERALAAFRLASRALPSWAEPHVRLAQILIAEGRGASDEAARAAEDARLAGTNADGNVDLPAAIVNIKVSYARLAMAPDANNTAALLSEVKQLQTQIPNEPQTLPIYVALLWQTGQRDLAIDEITQACSNPTNGGEDMLMELVQTSRAAKLGMEPQIYSAIQNHFGLTPRAAYARAIEMLNAGQSADGLKLLTDSQQNSKNPADAIYWDCALCQYREAAKMPDAAAGWQKLGDKYPNDVLVQSTILTNGNSAWTNREFIRQTIDRLKSLTSESAIGWQTAYARWLLTGDANDNNTNEAVTILTRVTNDSPEDYLPHVLLATAYDRLKNNSAGIEEWRKAAEMEPESADAQFAYLQALHLLGKKEEVRVEFDKLAGIPNLSPDIALAAANILAAEGDMPRAEHMLLEYPHATNQVFHDATLAKVYRIENRPNDAAALYFGLVNSPKLDLNTIREAADFFGAQNQIPEARKFLDRLAELQLGAAKQLLIRAAFEEEHGTPEAAGNLYAQAVKADGGDSQAAIARIGFLIRQRNWTDSRDAVAAAVSQWPNDASIAALSHALTELSSSTHLDQMQPLIEAITNDPQSAPANETLALATDPNATVSQIRALLDKYPDFEPAYELVTRRLMASGNPGDAVSVARDAMGRFGRSADAARTAAEANAAAGNWNDAMIAGRQWRDRLTENPRPADLFIAMADLAIAQPGDAADRLAPYIADAKSQPDANRNLITLYAQALIRSGRQADAVALLQPLTKDSASWRMAWLELAPVSFSNTADSENWISQVKPALAPTIDEQADLAEVYVACGEHSNEPQEYAEAMDTLKPFLDTPQMGAAQWLIYAGAATGKGDNASALRAYRRVLQLDPTNAIAENNLADLLSRTGDSGSLKEAQSLASAAVAAHPNDPQAFNYYDTLARIMLKEGRPADAIATFKKGNALNPRDLDILIGLAATCAKNGQVDDAVQYLSQIDGLIPMSAHLAPDLEAELASARQQVRKNDSRSSVTGTDFSPSGK